LAEDILVSWSGGKDSALALHQIMRGGEYKVRALLTTVTEEYDRVSMHGVRRRLLHAQASSMGLALEEVWIPKNSSNEVYEARMKAVLMKHRERGLRTVAFGDLFLRDIREYRESRLARIDMRGIFPIWGLDTNELPRDLLRLGFKATVCCVDPKRLGKEFCGRDYDDGFLRSLPPGVDPCGENGEFHTFVHGGPIFRKELSITKGEVVLRDGFWFADLLPS
jgi:uncharacterized protein (TIGR00290 family)